MYLIVKIRHSKIHTYLYFMPLLLIQFRKLTRKLTDQHKKSRSITNLDQKKTQQKPGNKTQSE